jgi:hypothetical protein
MKTLSQKRWRKLHKTVRSAEYRRLKYRQRGYSEREIEMIMGKD